MSKTELTLVIISTLTLMFIVLPFAGQAIKILFKKTKYRQMGQSSQIRLIRQLHDAVGELSSTKTGAIITIVNKQDLVTLRTDGVLIDANISSALIVAIFNKKSPIHDGAIIIDNKKITYAGTYFKITSKSVDNRYGARHRAALGVSEQSDALTIVVSEETGHFSFVKEGNIIRVKLADFQEKLIEYLKN